jgi:signal transduction histidine kinase
VKHRLSSLWLVLFAVFFVRDVNSFAQNQALKEMQHSTWTGHDGVPLGIRAIAMGPEGLLYLATYSNLYRFDGTLFEPVPVAGVEFTSAISDLCFTRQGDLLLLFSHGPPVLLHKGRGEFLDGTDGANIEMFSRAQQTPDGRLWAVLNEKQIVILGDDWVWHVVAVPGGGRAHITRLFGDAQGTLWSVIDDQLFRRPRDGAFQTTGVFVYGDAKFVQGLHSDLWIASSGATTSVSPVRHLQHLDSLGGLLETREIAQPLTAAYPAMDGSLWLLTTQSLLGHLPRRMIERRGPPLDMKRLRDTVTLHTAIPEDSATALNSFILAKDGSIWIGGLGGIERFQKAALIPLVPDATPGLWDHCFGRNGRQWIVDPHGSLYLRLRDGTMKPKGSSVQALYCSAFGNLLRNKTGLSVLKEEHARSLPSLPGLKGYGNHYIFTGATSMADGSIVAVAAGGAIGRSLWRFHAGRWSQLDTSRLMSEASGIYATQQNSAYFGFRDGTVGLLDPGATQVRSVDKVGTNAVIGFAPTRWGLVAYGASGLALWRNGYFTVLSFSDPLLAKMVTGLVESAHGDFWLNGSKGIVRVTHEEVSATLQDSSHRMIANQLTEGDFTGPSTPRLFSRTVQADARGDIWFNTLNGIVLVTSCALQPPEPPPIVIKSVLADGKPLPPTRTFPPDLNSLSIRYIGIDFSNPSGLSYSYKLVGYDDGWQDVGSRTEAVYTHLRAGRYTFVVKARNAFGSSTSPVSLEPFVIQPHFYEGPWFLATVVVLLVALIWLAVQLRLRFAAADIRRLADERADERISIARDLHDTLLQGVQGLLLTFHAAIEGVAARHEARPALEHALSRAEKLIIEGRDRVKGLRGAQISGDELGQLLQSVAEDLGCADRFTLSISAGSVKTILQDRVASELFLIGRETLVNATRHAHASHITMRLHFGSRAFSLECEDDGVGFDPLSSNARQHRQAWGIRGMRERIEALHGSLRITSEPGKGALVRVFIKARFAYR